MDNGDNGINQAYQAGMQNFQDTLAGAAYGAQNLSATVQVGSARLISDIGRLMPPIASPQMHPYMQVRHGMYAHEMSFSGDIGAQFGYGIPSTTTGYEYQELAARDLGNRVGQATVATGVYGGSTLATGAAFMPGIAGGWKGARALGKMAKLGTVGLGAAGIAGAALGLAPVLAIEAMTDKVMDDVKDRSDVMGFLEASSFRYATGGGDDIDSHFGSGFNKKARSKIAGMMKKMDLTDSTLDMKDLKGVLESGTELGMFTGANTADEFGKKFKDLTTTLKKVTEVLHTSLADGMKTIKDLKDQGYTAGAGMNAAIMKADVLGTASGRTAAEMLSIGRQGSEMVRGTGIGMSTGSTMLQSMTSMVGVMSNSGALDAETIRQAGGQGQLAQTMMGSSINFMRSAYGRGALMAATTSDGTLNMGALDSIAGGGTSLQQMNAQATGGLPSVGAYMKQIVNQEENVAKLAKQYGGRGMQMFQMGANITAARAHVQTDPSIDMDTALRYQMKMQGMSGSEIKAQMGMLENIDDFRSSQARGLRLQGEKAISQMIDRRMDLTGKLADEVDRLVAPLSEGVGRISDDISNTVSGWARGTNDWYQEEIHGIKKIQMGAIKAKEMDAVIANMDNISLASDTIYSKSIYTDAQRKNYAKTDEYKEMEDKYANNSVSPAAARAKDADAYSKALIGRNYGSLTKKEKMYVENQAEQAGRTMIKENIDARQRKAENALINRDFASLEGAKEKAASRKEELVNAREELADQIGGDGVMGTGAALRKVIESGDSGKMLFDKFVKAKQTLDAFATNRSLSPEEEAKRKKAEIEVNKLKNKMAGKAGRLGRHLLVGDMQKVDEKKARLLGLAKENVAQADLDVKSTQLLTTAADNIRAASKEGLDTKRFGEDEADKYQSGLDELSQLIRTGKGDITDLQGMAKLAAKTDNTGMSAMLRQAAKIETQGGDAHDFLQKESFKRFGNTIGGTKVLSKDADSTDLESEAGTMRSLSKVQAETSRVLLQLEALSARLERKGL